MQTSLLAKTPLGLDMPGGPRVAALVLLASGHRIYQPLLNTWEFKWPGTKAALARLVADGLVIKQNAILVDERTGKSAKRAGRSVTHYTTTSAGTIILARPGAIDAVAQGASTIGRECAKTILRLANTHSGMGPGDLVVRSGHKERTVRWWIERLLALGYLEAATQVSPYVQEIVPAHWRATSKLWSAVHHALKTYSVCQDPGVVEMLTKTRRRTLPDIPNKSVAGLILRDLKIQTALAMLLQSPAFQQAHTLRLGSKTPGVHRADASWKADAQWLEQSPGGPRLAILELERTDTRTRMWQQLELILAGLARNPLPSGGGVVRLLCQQSGRVTSYVELIEGFTAYGQDHPDRMLVQPVLLAVSSFHTTAEAFDPLADDAWFRLLLPIGSGRTLVHRRQDSPVSDYVQHSITQA